MLNCFVCTVCFFYGNRVASDDLYFVHTMSWLDELALVSWTSQLDVCSMFA